MRFLGRNNGPLNGRGLLPYAASFLGSREATAEPIPHARSPAAGGLRGDSGLGLVGLSLVGRVQSTPALVFEPGWGSTGECLIIVFRCTGDEAASSFRELDGACAGFLGDVGKLYAHLTVFGRQLSNYTLTQENISVSLEV